MVLTSRVSRTCGFLIYLFYHVNATINNNSEPRIVSMKIKSKLCDEIKCKYLFNVSGGEFVGDYSWRLTSAEGARGGRCDVIHPNYEIKLVECAHFSAILEVIVPNVNGRLYFCLHNNAGKNSPFDGEWLHQGTELYLDPKNDVISYANM